MALPTGAGALKFVKYAVRAAEWAAPIVLGALTYDEPVTNEELLWRRLQAIYTRATPTGTQEDKAVCTFDFVNITSGAIDGSWTAGDYTTVEGILDTMFTGIAGNQSNKVTLSQYRWYARAFLPVGQERPIKGGVNYFADSLIPERVVSKSIVGGSSNAIQMPYQVALSVTEKTPLPKHWGRFYIPNPAAVGFDAFGRWMYSSAIAGYVGTAYDDLADANFYAVVPVGKSRALLGVTSLQVDDVPDVQRRRRPRQTLVRAVAP